VIERMLGVLRAHTFRFADERELQDSVAVVLSGCGGFAVEREVRAGPDRFDLRVGTVVVEVKIAGGSAAALQQCLRYLQREDVTALLLIGPPLWGADPFPPTLAGKPFAFLPIGRAAF
jgi:hypothetical protein